MDLGAVRCRIRGPVDEMRRHPQVLLLHELLCAGEDPLDPSGQLDDLAGLLRPRGRFELAPMCSFTPGNVITVFIYFFQVVYGFTLS